MKKSPYVLKLEELGFRKAEGENAHDGFSDILTLVEETIKRKLPRHDRRRLRAFMSRDIKNNPSYTVSRFTDGTALTEATDDTGQLWEVASSVNLEVFGFKNNAKMFLEMLYPKKPTSH